MRAALGVARAAILLLAAGALSGCFFSDDPLIARRYAENPFAEGHYVHAPVNPEDGVEWAGATWEGDIRYTRDRRYRSDTPNFPHQDARFISMGGNVYLAQIPDRDGEDVYSYGLAWLYAGGVISYHAPHCSDLDDALRGEVGLSMDLEGGCRIDDLETLMTAMSAWLDAHQDDNVQIDGIYRLVE